VNEAQAGTRAATPLGTAVLRYALAILLVASAVTGLTWAMLAWTTTVTISDGNVCASAFRYHPGSGYLPNGGEQSDAVRRAFADVCDQAGARSWHTGWVALLAGLGVGAACALGLVAVGRRRPRAT
jgi:hypothetical protein